MDVVSLEEAKKYLRIDYADDDDLIGLLLTSATSHCVDVARLSAEQWEDVLNENPESEYYTSDEITHIREQLRVAILYDLAYVFEHREEADHSALNLSLRAILSAVREAANL